MGKSIGSVFLELDRRMTEQSFKGLNGIVNKVVNNLKPVTLKLNTKDTTKEFSKLTEVLKDVQANINKINSAAAAGGGRGALTKQANDIRQAYNDIMKYQKQIGNLEIQLTKGNKGAAEIAELTAQLDRLKQKREELKSSFDSKFSTAQTEALAKSWDEVQNKVKLAQAAMADRKSAQDAAAAQKEMAAAEKEAAQAAKEKAKADKEAEREETQRVNSLKTLYNMLRQVNKIKEEIASGRGGTGHQDYLFADSLSNELQAAIDKGGVASGVVRQFGNDLAKLKNDADASGSTLKEVISPLDQLQSRLIYMASASNLIIQGVRQFKQMFNTVVELDSAMTQLKIVTNNTDQEYAEFGKNTSKVAQNIGVSTKDLIDSTTTFARLGYSLSESGDLARLTAMLSKVGDVDVSSAQNAMTAITKAFDDVDTSNIESAMDKMVEVGKFCPRLQ